MKDKTSWFIRLEDTADAGTFGIGECGPLPGLSVDDRPDFEQVLSEIIQRINNSSCDVSRAGSVLDFVGEDFPAIIFGLETAVRDLQHGGKRIIYDNHFLRGQPILINGLIWMGDMDFMMDQINKKIDQGFTCIKIKVGGLDFDRECDILSYLRKRYFRSDITIRLDANGALKIDEVLYKLDELARFNIHSIEQPIKPGLAEMEELCRKSPIPVAFDEELIGIQGAKDKALLLKNLKPKFIVLKPTLHGGLKGCGEWISIADSMDIGWWITSALESSIGLNAICQFAANHQLRIPQGLGTGGIYDNNIPSPLSVKNGTIFYDSDLAWDETTLQG
jgi:o-succinylbenzoate synthase